MDKNVKKGRLSKVYEILKTTDEFNSLTTNEIIDKLKSYNINCVRKTLYEDIKALIDLGYDIVVNKTQTNNYYMIDNNLELSEARLLVDTINQANFISGRMTDDLINKIGSLTPLKISTILKYNFNINKNQILDSLSSFVLLFIV